MKTSLSPNDVARAIGVSESTLKRWADAGRIEVSKTLGGHRRIDVREALRFAREAALPIQRPEILGLPELALVKPEMKRPDAVDETLYKLLVEGQEAEARGMVLDLYLNGMSVHEICDGPMHAALHRLGELWKDNKQEGVMIEHRATDICSQALHELRPLVDPVSAQLSTSTQNPAQAVSRVKRKLSSAVGAAPPGDHYRLSSLMVCLTLLERQYNAVSLGANLPFASLLTAAKNVKAELVWITCTDAAVAPTAKQVYDFARQVGDELNATLAIGGQAAPSMSYDRPENVFAGRSLGELAAFVQGTRQT